MNLSGPLEQSDTPAERRRPRQRSKKFQRSWSHLVSSSQRLPPTKSRAARSLRKNSAPPYLIHGLPRMLQNVKLVIHDPALRHLLL